jgi:hypothetical protein
LSGDENAAAKQTRVNLFHLLWFTGKKRKVYIGVHIELNWYKLLVDFDFLSDINMRNE